MVQAEQSFSAQKLHLQPLELPTESLEPRSCLPCQLSSAAGRLTVSVH